MADLTLEILQNKDKYPDDRKIVLGDGEEITCGELRNTLQPRAAFTKASEEWGRTERELRGTVQGLQQQLSDTLAQAERAGKAPEPEAPRGGYTKDQLLADPLLGPIYQELEESKRDLKAHQERLSLHETYVKTREYDSRLDALGSRFSSRFNKDGKGKTWDKAGFLDYVQRNPLFNLDPRTRVQDVDLEAIYDRYTREDEIALREKDAEDRGLERGKRTVVPPSTFGRRRSAVVKDKSLPETFGEVTTDQIANDPDIQAAMFADQEAG